MVVAAGRSGAMGGAVYSGATGYGRPPHLIFLFFFCYFFENYIYKYSSTLHFYTLSHTSFSHITIYTFTHFIFTHHYLHFHSKKMHGRNDDSPGSHESGHGSNPSQPSGYGGVPSGYGGFPSQPWSWNQPPPAWASSPTPPPSQPWRSSPTQPLARNLSRSAFGDYRPDLDSLNHPRPETPFQSSQSPFTDADQDALDTMMDLISSGVPDTPVTTSVRGSQRGGGDSGGGGGGSGNVSGAGGSGSGVGSGGGSQSGSVQVGKKKPIHYTKAESVAVARAWDAATSDPILGTDQTEFSFWKRVVQAYNEFKPRDSIPRDGEQLRKKWSRILPATRRFAGIYQNNLLHAESGRSEADVKELSMEQYKTLGNSMFTMWEEFLVLQDCPKFKAICAQEQSQATKRTRHNIAGDYSSGSGSQSFDLNEEQAAEPSATHSRRARPPGQRASIRRAREAGGSSRRSSAASGSRASQPASIPPSRAPFASAVLKDTVYVQLAHELNDACSKYETATDPYIKNIYSDLIRRIQRRLRLADEGPGVAAAGGNEGDVEGDEEGDGDEEEESDDATE